MIVIIIATIGIGISYLCIFHPVIVTNHLSHAISDLFFKAKRLARIK